ncbi:MAG: pyridoxal phosphate-dependent aminotransferase [Dehalococcoidia bacterium]|nr:pyridoxal phosphate-dependent aminotransferase [Dehalococcoidia bacterium]MDP7083253.1 pyridoxal phosphate-dependent aminotransferase [Dehalococcoidia bacterium]MDP7200721.1 pyridoxal phosphate-dependent aminotransferase [Dehalococcoidia bacterium]MDP7510291.1 pyridoxal phosphate-dependent aminotransferase [Dehalococcoidia bacterium]HJN87788.1 pyridoxal phosphate-dependent aminotransferase [Dehalococcoidia bacterium]
MAVSQKVRGLVEQGGWIRRMFESGIALKAQHGEDKVFDLSLGNPVVEPPELFVQELRRLAEHPVKGMHRYMPNAGYPETRQAVADGLKDETGLPFAAGHIVMTCGAAAALNVVLKTILDPAQEVIILAPYFVEYGFYVDNHAGVAVTVSSGPDFQPDLEAIEAAVTPKTRAVIINSPNNPTGAVYPAAGLAKLAGLLQRKQEEHGTEIFLISDEPYRRIIYDGLSYPQVFPHYQNTIVVNSHAKDLALPGERIGYIAVNPAYLQQEELVDGLTFCNRTLGFVNAPALMQHVVRALQGVSVDVAGYQRKRDYLCAHLTELGYSVVKPQGAFYLFPKSPLEDDVAFVNALLEWNVLVVPGRGFGTPGYFRISYCTEDRVLEGAMEGFARAAERFGL